MQEHHPRVSPTGIAYLGIRQRRRECAPLVTKLSKFLQPQLDLHK
ncbi:unnamed protein product [Tenebrio molitor]|nr:unnamed protein product [Tenebrio molitor]